MGFLKVFQHFRYGFRELVSVVSLARGDTVPFSKQASLQDPHGFVRVQRQVIQFRRSEVFPVSSTVQYTCSISPESNGNRKLFRVLGLDGRKGPCFKARQRFADVAQVSRDARFTILGDVCFYDPACWWTFAGRYTGRRIIRRPSTSGRASCPPVSPRLSRTFRGYPESAWPRRGGRFQGIRCPRGGAPPMPPHP